MSFYLDNDHPSCFGIKVSTYDVYIKIYATLFETAKSDVFMDGWEIWVGFGLSME